MAMRLLSSRFIRTQSSSDSRSRTVPARGDGYRIAPG